MKLYVCYGTFPTPRPGGHPCGHAYNALRDAGYDPEVKRSYGWGALPEVPFNMTTGRRAVKRLTGKSWVPAVVLDDGHVIQGSKEIIDWAQANPAGATAA